MQLYRQDILKLFLVKVLILYVPHDLMQSLAPGEYDIQSINQSNFYSANIPGEARLGGVTTKSVSNSKIEKTVP